MTIYSTIPNGANRPLNYATGTIPDVSGSLKDWFQPLTFTKIVKTVVGYQVVETPTNVTFMGLVQPFSERQLILLPEGQRGWSWFSIYADPVLTLQIDEVVSWRNSQSVSTQLRVMGRTDYGTYFYVQYRCVQDWQNSGPNP